MLVLTRKAGERIYIGETIEVVVLATRGDRVQLGFAAPADVPILREEVRRRMQGKNARLAIQAQSAKRLRPCRSTAV
jgi:carbon storage regulator